MQNKMNCIVCSGQTQRRFIGLFDDRYGAKGKHDIYVCENCGFGRTFPGIKKADIGRFYKENYPLNLLVNRNLKIQSKLKSDFYYWINGLNNKAHRYVKSKSKVLDVGSASGISLLELKQMGAVPYGVEPDPNAQQFARKYKLKVQEGFLTDNPFPRIKFDYVTASQVIEHEPEIHKFMEFANRKLMKKGLLILSFPNFNSPLRRLLKKRWIHWHIPYHFNFFTKKSIEILSKKYGFRIVKYKTITPNLWIILQIRSMGYNAAEGKSNPVWSTQDFDNKVNKTNKNKFLLSKLNILKRKLLFALMYLGYVPITILYRFVDAFGYGESVLVTLKKVSQ